MLEISVDEMHPHPKCDAKSMSSMSMDKMNILISGLNVHESKVEIDINYNNTAIEINVSGGESHFL